MNGPETTQLLRESLRLSQELARAADGGDAARAASIDAERAALLRRARSDGAPCSDAQRALLGEIARLNDAALGKLEHHLRIKARELDTAAAGRKAVVAYGATG